jgi:D-alanyl-lipoteichoic acid acyltransferase DltB (MBOAT superfamily)
VLFNSFEFLFLFFPATLASYWLCQQFGDRAQQLMLLAASLIFYSFWDVRFLPLLIGSILVNYGVGLAIWRCTEQRRERAASLLLSLGVAANLAAIGVFKYAGFFIGNINLLSGTNLFLDEIILPLGISFFTFEQISFLVDVRHGQSRPSDPLRYALFVSFFPRVVAGPILRFREIYPQLARPHRRPVVAEDLMVGLTIFFFGLVKKTVLADGVAPYATSVFHSASTGSRVDFFSAWSGILAYTCQLYFDFSGYSDMAIGAARCFGIRFPMNFCSPYQATNIIEFWRRWHITLSRFLRDYLYIGLGGNRRGTTRRYINLMITMLLGGLWHGANWTFVIWGGLHGCYLMINHAWLAASRKSAAVAGFRGSRVGAGFGWALTFLAVVVAWVFFRAPSLDVAFTILKGMIGQNGIAIPAGLAFALEPIHGLIAALGITFNNESGTEFVKAYLWVTPLLAIALLAPNTQQLMRGYNPVLDLPATPSIEVGDERGLACLRLKWVPSPGWAIATGTLAFFGIISITRVSEFLYWQF